MPQSLKTRPETFPKVRVSSFVCAQPHKHMLDSFGHDGLERSAFTFPSIDIATSPWSAAPMVWAKRSGSPATIFPAS